jgi:hypothetical protein
MSHEYLAVAAGIDMSKALNGQRITKRWLRDYLRDHPEKDFRILNTRGHGGAYVNGQDAITNDLTLEVRSLRAGSNELVALVDFQPTDDNEWGYQAVVR